MQVYARRREARDIGRPPLGDRAQPVGPVRIVAPGVCYILVDRRRIAQVLAAHPDATVTPLIRQVVPA